MKFNKYIVVINLMSLLIISCAVKEYDSNIEKFIADKKLILNTNFTTVKYNDGKIESMVLWITDDNRSNILNALFNQENIKDGVYILSEKKNKIFCNVELQNSTKRDKFARNILLYKYDK